jgi:hypothetical protein
MTPRSSRLAYSLRHPCRASHAEPDGLASDTATPEDLQFLEEQINEYNFAATDIHDARLIVMLHRD